MGWRDSLKGWAFDFAVATGAGLFFGLIGPFGSYLNGPVWQRVGFQLVCFWMGVLVYGTGVRLVLQLRLPRPWPWAAIVAMTAVLTAPFSQIVAAFGRALWPFLARQGAFEWYLQGLTTAEPVVLGMTLLIARRRRTAEARQAAQAPTPVAAHDGLLGVAPSEVLCLQMEDHYVRIHLRAGSRLVPATLSQAVAALGGREGLQVHRSWWVASRAVVQAEAHGRNLKLRLTNGVLAPVARSAVPAVRAAGWIGEGAETAQREGA
jgi:DNA-binding LytR/AlgR family response regulator